MRSALSLQDIDAYYGDSHVLQKMSFELGEGRLLGLLGRNGAGKSTCMSVTVGLLPPRAAMRSGGNPVTAVPNTETSPARGGNSPTVTFMQVVLPAPLRPSKPSRRPSGSRNDTRWSTWLSP